jgi:hypothetical protein
MTETSIDTPVREVIDGYFAMWNETDPVRRRRIIEETWMPDASYIEPLMAAEGHEGLDDGVAALQAQFPGHTLHPAGRVDAHHDRVRWSWELLGPDGGAPLAAGTNVGVLAPDGRLRQVTGFFDSMPIVA